jgi:hypothetical protein
MSIPYNLNIPFSTHNPSVDQPNMLTNTNSIATYVAVDHVPFNTTGSGQHNQVTFNNIGAQSVPSDPTSILYTVNDAFSHPQLAFINSQNFANIASPNGVVLVFAGIIIQWGSASTTGSSVAFPTAFPHNAFSMVVTGSATPYTGGFVVSALSRTNFTVTRTSGSGATGYYYIAIGN